MTSSPLPFYKKTITDVSSGLVFETENGDLALEFEIDECGRIKVHYEFRIKVPTLKREQRN